MSELACPGCREREAQIARLEHQVAELTAQLARMAERVRQWEPRLDQNSPTSSTPPPANPPQAPPPVRKQPTGRKPGGQPGHTAHLRQRLPPERLTAPTVHYLPEHCATCQHALPSAPGPEDP